MLQLLKNKIQKNKSCIFSAFLSIGIGLSLSFFQTEQMKKSIDFLEINIEKSVDTIEDKIEKTIFQINPNSKLVSSENIEKLNELGKMELNSKNKKDITLELYNKKEYFLSLVSFTEGFNPKIHKDNIGFAWGMGLNLTKQNKEFNYELIKTVFPKKSKNEIEDIASLSKKKHSDINLKDFNKYTIAPQQAVQMSEILYDHFKDEYVLKGISSFIQKKYKKEKKEADKISNKIFYSLASNEKAALVYHSYKVGYKGFTEYENLLTKLYGYSQGKVAKKEVVEEFEYEYKTKVGKKIVVKKDKQAEDLIQAMFTSPKSFIEKTNIQPAQKVSQDTPKAVDKEKLKNKIAEIRFNSNPQTYSSIKYS